jgi:anti-anti-sigma factor
MNPKMPDENQQKIQTSDFTVYFEESEQTVVLMGSLRLNAAPEYEPISQLMTQALEKLVNSGKPTMVLDVRDLKFLNSSGINLLYQFVLKVRKQGGIGLKVLGSSSNAWQTKSLGNMTKFMPTLLLEIN